MNNRTGKPVIPLQCSLCPKSPQFSDISHLLTHISSKGHLSHKFKLSIRCHADPSARTQLEAFEIWYADNGLAELLAERLHSKESKTTKRTRASKSTQGAKPKSTRNKDKMVAQPDKYDQAKSRQPPERPMTPTRFKMPTPAPPMGTWNTRPMLMLGSPYEESEPSCKWEQGESYATPTTRRYLPNFSQNGGSEEDGGTQITSSPTKAGNELGELQDDNGGDNSKLKGIVWEGMGLFDSATTEMRRMRNQKKDGSILAQMKITSKEVIPNEIVYNTLGEVQRVKDIYETSPENSPVSASKTTKDPAAKKQQVRRTRKPRALPLRSMDVNVSMSQNRQRGKHSTRDSTRSRSSYDGADDDYRPYNPFGFDRPLKRSVNEDEFAMTAGTYGKRQKLGVFRDPAKEQEEPSPGRTESPLGGHRFDYQHPVPIEPSPSHRLPHFSPPPLQRPGSLRLMGGKENAPNEYHPHRLHGSESSFPPQAFHSQNQNPLFSYNHSYSYPSYGYDAPAPSVYQNEARRLPTLASSGDFKPMLLHSPYREPPGSQQHHSGHEQPGFTNPFYLGM